MICIASCIVVILFFGYGVFTKQALHNLERQYPPFSIDQLKTDVMQQIRYVVVLGNAHVSDPGLPESAKVSSASLYRLVEGIRIYRQLPGTRLIISGGINLDPVANAVMVSCIAQQIGINRQEIIVEDRPRDTFEEAELLQPLLGKAPFVLVSSAAHMPRAIRLFQHFDMSPLPAPTDFILKDRPHAAIDTLLPSCGNLEISKRVIYEWLGEVWGWMKKISGSSQ